MKKTVLIYCADDSRGAKALAAQLRGDAQRVFLHSASGFTGVVDPRCDMALVMPDVQPWMRDRIQAAYGPEKAWPYIDPPREKTESKFAAGIDVGQYDAILYGKTIPVNVALTSGLSAVHRGRGSWYVMRGSEIISGPHTKEEAQRLAA